jgi:hypothetical protein
MHSRGGAILLFGNINLLPLYTRGRNTLAPNCCLLGSFVWLEWPALYSNIYDALHLAIVARNAQFY